MFKCKSLLTTTLNQCMSYFTLCRYYMRDLIIPSQLTIVTSINLIEVDSHKIQYTSISMSLIQMIHVVSYQHISGRSRIQRGGRRIICLLGVCGGNPARCWIGMFSLKFLQKDFTLRKLRLIDPQHLAQRGGQGFLAPLDPPLTNNIKIVK